MKRRNPKQLDYVQMQIESTFILKVECTICADETREQEFDGDCNRIIAKETFAKELYDEGWREAVSKTFGQVGLTCPKCIADKKNKCTVK